MSILDGNIGQRIDKVVDPVVTPKLLIEHGFQKICRDSMYFYKCFKVTRWKDRVADYDAWLDISQLGELPVNFPIPVTPEKTDNVVKVYLPYSVWAGACETNPPLTFNMVRICTEINFDEEGLGLVGKQYFRQWSHAMRVSELIKEINTHLHVIGADYHEYIK